MKNLNLKYFFIIIVLIASLITGSFDNSLNCVSDNCCKTECCEENSSSDFSGTDISLNNTDCCEFSRALKNEVLATSSSSTGTKTNIIAQSISFYQILNQHNRIYNIKQFISGHIPLSNSISILRI